MNKKKLEKLKIFLTHLQEQESGLRINNGLNEKGQGFLPNHIGNCKRLTDLYKEAGLISQDYECDLEAELSEEAKKLIDEANKDFEDE